MNINKIISSTFIICMMITGINVSAKSIVRNVQNGKGKKVEKNQTSKTTIASPLKLNAACSNWVTVTAHCGAVYYLCSDRYSNTKEMMEAAMEINEEKC